MRNYETPEKASEGWKEMRYENNGYFVSLDCNWACTEFCYNAHMNLEKCKLV